MRQDFQVEETILYHAFSDEDVLLNYRGSMNIQGQPQAVVFNPRSGVQGVVAFDRLEHTSLWHAVEAAKQAGYTEINTLDGWTPLDAWRAAYPQALFERFVFVHELIAIVDDTPTGRVQRVWRVRRAADETPIDLVQVRAACHIVTDDINRLQWLQGLINLALAHSKELSGDDEDAVLLCLREVQALHDALKELISEAAHA